MVVVDINFFIFCATRVLISSYNINTSVERNIFEPVNKMKRVSNMYNKQWLHQVTWDFTCKNKLAVEPGLLAGTICTQLNGRNNKYLQSMEIAPYHLYNFWHDKRVTPQNLYSFYFYNSWFYVVTIQCEYISSGAAFTKQYNRPIH